MSVAKSSAQTFAITAFATLLSMITGVIIGRSLGPAGKGAAQIAISAPLLLALTGNLGIQTSIVYFIGQKDSKPQAFYFTSAVLSLIIGALIASLVYLLKAQALASIMKGLSPVMFLIAAISVPLALWMNAQAAILIGKSLIREFNKTTLSHQLIALPCTILFVVVLRWGALGAVIAYMAGLIFRLVLSSYYIWRLCGIEVKFHPALSKQLLGYGWRAHIGNAVTQLNNRLDMFILNALAGNASVGIYQVGVNFAEMMYQVPEALRTVIHPKLVASNEYANQATPKASRQVILLGVAMSVLGIILCKPIIVLMYGAKFAQSALPFKLLLPGVIALSSVRLVFADLQSRGKPLLTGYASMVGLVPTIVLDLLLIPTMGPAGAAIASSVSYVSVCLYGAGAFSRLSGVRMIELFKVGRSDLEVYSNVLRKVRQKMGRAA